MSDAGDHAARALRERGLGVTQVSRGRRREVLELGMANAMAARKRAGAARNPWSPLSPRGRLAVLRKIGFSDFKEYLASDLWRGIRSAALMACGGLCSCGKAADQVHHERYTERNLLGKSLDGLAGICCGCHPEADRAMRRRWYR